MNKRHLILKDSTLLTNPSNRVAIIWESITCIQNGNHEKEVVNNKVCSMCDVRVIAWTYETKIAPNDWKCIQFGLLTVTIMCELGLSTMPISIDTIDVITISAINHNCPYLTTTNVVTATAIVEKFSKKIRSCKYWCVIIEKCFLKHSRPQCYFSKYCCYWPC